MSKLKNYSLRQYEWYHHNLSKIVFVAGLHIVSSFVVMQPYINIFTSLFSFLPFFLDWIAILILFKPAKESILKTALFLFVIGFFFELLKVSFVLEVLGQIAFFMFGTYIILSLHEIKK